MHLNALCGESELEEERRGIEAIYFWNHFWKLCLDAREEASQWAALRGHEVRKIIDLRRALDEATVLVFKECDGQMHLRPLAQALGDIPSTMRDYKNMIHAERDRTLEETGDFKYLWPAYVAKQHGGEEAGQRGAAGYNGNACTRDLANVI